MEIKRVTLSLVAALLLVAPLAFGQTLPPSCTSAATDDFTRANATSLGGNWSDTTSTAWQITSNRATRPSISTASVATYTATSLNGNQCSSMKTIGWRTNEGPTINGDGATATGNIRAITGSCSSGTCTTVTVVKDSNTTLDTITGVSVSSTKTLSLVRINSTTVRVYLDTTQIGSDYTESSKTTGSPGMYCSGTILNGSSFGAVTNWVGSNYGNPVATPSISGDASAISITDSTSGATIIYTLDGTTPTADGAGNATHGTVYSGSFSTTGSVVKAIGSKSGMDDSGIATYNIAATPTISPLATAYFSQQSITLACTSPSPSIYYTTDGTTPTTSSTLYTGAFNSVSSGTETVKALCTSSGYGGSQIASFAYNIAPTNTQLFSADFSDLYHAGLGGDRVPQLPLDQWTTAGVWKMNGTLSGVMADAQDASHYISVLNPSVCTVHSAGYCVGLRDPGPGGTTQSFVTYTGATLGADQYAKAYITPITSSGTGGVGVGCATDGSLTGYTLLAGVASGHAILRKVVSGTPTTLSDVSGLTIAAHTAVELRRIASGTASQALQALIGGSVVATVTDTAITGGQPCIALGNSTLNGISDFTAGGVGNSTYSANSYSPSYSDFTDAANTSGWTPVWPLFHSVDSLLWTALFEAHVYNTTLYGIGSDGSAQNTQYEYRRPTGLNQFLEFKPTINPWDTALNNMFGMVKHETWIPGLADGGCAAAGTTSVCFDELSDYVGTEYMAKNRFDLGLTGCTSGASAKDETCGSPFLHFTKVTGTPSSTNSSDPNYCAGGSVLAHGCNNVISGAQSFYTPTLALGDTIHIEAVGNHVRAYCKGGSSPASRQNSHAYSLNDLIQDSNGNLQRVVTAGTSGSSGPSTWASNWGLASQFNGDHTTDGGVTWEYFGKACPTVGSWSMVFDAVENENASVPGFTGLWQGGAPAAVFTAISTGTVTDAGLCSTLPEGCGGQQPMPIVW